MSLTGPIRSRSAHRGNGGRCPVVQGCLHPSATRGWRLSAARPVDSYGASTRHRDPRSTSCDTKQTVTSSRWIPSEAVTGLNKAIFGTGFTHYDAAAAGRRSSDLEALRDGGSVPLRQPPVGLDRGRRTAGSSTPATTGGVLMGSTTVAAGRQGRDLRGGLAARPPARPVDRRRTSGHLRADRRRPHRRCPRRAGSTARRSCSSQAPTVWTTLSLTIHADGRSESRADRRQPVPPPLGLRRRRQAGGQGRPRRLQGLVAALVRRPAHPVGRRGLARAGDRRRDRPRAGAGRTRSCRAAPSRSSASLKAGATLTEQGAPATRCSCCSTACCRSRSTASRWPRSARARSSASGPCSKAGVRTSTLRGRHQGQGRRRPRRPDRPRRPGRGQQRVTGARDAPGEASASAASAARPLHPAPSSCAVGGNTSCVAVWPDGRPGASPDPRRRHGHPVGHRAARRRAVPRHDPAHATCTGTTCRACRSSPAATATTPRCGCCCPTTAATPPRPSSGRAMSPPHFPIGPEGLRGQWRFDALDDGEHEIEGLDVIGRRGAAQGRTHVRLPGRGRRRLVRLPARPPPGHEPVPDAPRVIDLVADVDVLIHDAQFTSLEGALSPPTTAIRRSTRRSPWPPRPGPRAVVFHHAPARTDDEIDELVAALGPQKVPVRLALEGAVLTL